MAFTDKQILLAFATAIGAYGGFPNAPAAFSLLTRYEIFQWFLVFVLIYQGGGGQDIKFSLMITAALYMVHVILDRK